MAQPSFDSILNAVMLAESGGRRYDEKGNLLTSPKGAKGEMQVLDRTKFSPGFGVEPAKANTPDERARVGRDYLKAMLDRYGDVDKALAAYNWGPGNTDKWIARGADPAKLPDETKKYISRVKTTLTSEPRTTAQAPSQPMPEAAVPPAPAAGAPRAAPRVAPVRVGEARPADLGASYQAALALSFLSDEDEKESGRREYDERQPSVAQQWLARETARVKPEMLAMPFRSPFIEPEPEPVKAAGGGFIAVGYNKGGEARIDRIKRTTPGLINLQNWSRAVAEDMYPREEDAPKRDAARHMLAAALMANKTTPGVAEFVGKAYEFKEAPIKTMGHMLGVSKPRADYETDTFNNALGTRFAGVARDPLELQRAVRASIERGEANLTPDEIRAFGYKEGGEVKNDEPTPEELERASKAAFGIVPSSGRGRKQGRVSETLQSGEAQKELAKGLTMLPQNVVGAPVDLATLAMRPFGYRVEKPVMGSEWLKEKSRAAGVAFQEPTDPTLRGFFTAGDISSNLINPAGATRTAARGVEKTGEAAKMLQEFATRPVERDPFFAGPAGRQRGATRIPGQPDIAQYSAVLTPSTEQPFIGRLDEHVAGLSGTMQKEQFLNSLKGKFRDYDLARASQALADLGPTDKVKPAQILERLQTTYSPRNFNTTIHEPEKGMFYQAMDNVYYDAANPESTPLGVVNLQMKVTPEMAARQASADRVGRVLRGVFNAPHNPLPTEELNFVESYLRSDVGMPSDKVQMLVQTLKDAEKTGAEFRAIRQARSDLAYPTLSDSYEGIKDNFLNQLLQERGLKQELWFTVQPEAKKMAIDVIQKQAFDNLKTLLPNQQTDYWASKFFSGVEEDKKAVVNTVDLFASRLGEKLRADYRRMLSNEGKGTPAGQSYAEATQAIEQAQPYKGQHSTLRAGENPIGFSRFSDHTADIPGSGEVSIMHFHELQSDLLQDIRRYGSVKGSREKDAKELEELAGKIPGASAELRKAEDALRAAQEQVNTKGDAYAPYVKKAQQEVQALQREYERLSGRENVLRTRSAERGMYNMPEPFAGMETSPQVVQQLLIKNAINAAIQRGKFGATFPGKESSQSQLYENLPNNLKQVVKDLGPGFEVRPITLQGPNYTEFSHYGIFWGPEAAARIQKKGVPFKDGGMVERVDDTRRYL